MLIKKTVVATALATVFGLPMTAIAAESSDLARLRDEVRQMKEQYEARLKTLEERLQEAEKKADSATPPPPVATTSPQPESVAAASPKGFNPDIALILGGTYGNLSQDPSKYRQQGFTSDADAGPGSRGFRLGESELTLSANIDSTLAGKLTFSLAADDRVSVEEAFFTTQGLAHGVTLKGGRFLSSLGYLNDQHAHTWDFVDAPLVYRTFFNGQYKPDGLQLKWLAPTDRFLEFGFEAGRGATFPGSEPNKNGINSAAVYAHLGDDIGDSASWRTGVSYLRTRASNRGADDVATGVTNAFSGSSGTVIVDGIFKWAPNGNATQTNFKLQGEYFRRTENGDLTYDLASSSIGPTTSSYSTAQSGWYLQGVYQFMPRWRAGLRYDQLYAGTPALGLINSGVLARPALGQLASYDPNRASLMLDYSPSEFSRFRLQVAREKSRPDAAGDTQIFFQYIMSLGAHGAHSF